MENSLSDRRHALEIKNSQLPSSRPDHNFQPLMGGRIADQAKNNELAARLYRLDHSHPFTGRGNNSGKSNRR